MSKQPLNTTFAVTNLGAVKQGSLTQKPLTILCGPNNSGKTWVMYALYSYHKIIVGWEDSSENELANFQQAINSNLVNVFNANESLLKNAQFTPQLSSEDFASQLQSEYNTFLIPAERSGLHLFYRELGTRRTALLHHASKENINLKDLLRDVMHSRYAMPIAKYIDWLNQLSESQRRGSGDFHKYAEQLKKELVKGAYRVERSTGDITFKPYQQKRNGNPTPSLGLHMGSSVVKSLFGLWFYLEYQAKAGDLLMIDEPELNLHPENQLKIARLLARLVNAGLNLVVSTHSNYIVREFNSLIMLNDQRAQALREQHNYTKDEILNSDRIAAYLFDNQTIKPFEMSPDDGIYATTFDEVTRRLNQVNDDIYYSLQEA